MTAAEVLDREYLELRAKILQLAASFDRLDRSAGDVGADRRRELLHEGLAIAASQDADRAEHVQLLFSREYDDNWQAEFDIAPRG
jgi:hypothetical protein